MPIFVYKCDYCDRVTEEIRPVWEREDPKFCLHKSPDSADAQKSECRGTLIFQPIQKTSFRMQGFRRDD